LSQQSGGSLHVGGRGPYARANHEALGGQDLSFHALRLESVVGHGEIDGSAGLGGRHLKGAADHQRQALGPAGFPGNLGELPVAFLLIVPGGGAETTSSLQSSLSLSPAVMTRAEPSRLAL